MKIDLPRSICWLYCFLKSSFRSLDDRSGLHNLCCMDLCSHCLYKLQNLSNTEKWFINAIFKYTGCYFWPANFRFNYFFNQRLCYQSQAPIRLKCKPHIILLDIKYTFIYQIFLSHCYLNFNSIKKWLIIIFFIYFIKERAVLEDLWTSREQPHRALWNKK